MTGWLRVEKDSSAKPHIHTGVKENPVSHKTKIAVKSLTEKEKFIINVKTNVGYYRILIKLRTAEKSANTFKLPKKRNERVSKPKTKAIFIMITNGQAVILKTLLNNQITLDSFFFKLKLSSCPSKHRVKRIAALENSFVCYSNLRFITGRFVRRQLFIHFCSLLTLSLHPFVQNGPFGSKITRGCKNIINNSLKKFNILRF